MNIKDKLKKEGNVKMSAVKLMYIANVLRDHQAVLTLNLESSTIDGATENELEYLQYSLISNSIAIENVLGCIRELVGPEIYEKFLDGKIGDEIAKEGDDMSILTPSTRTLN